MSIFRFIKWIAQGDPLVIYGDGMLEEGLQRTVEWYVRNRDWAKELQLG